MNQTTSYNIFTIKDSNRNLTPRHIQDLKASINKYGYLESCPIIVNDKLEVLDGQHRLQACKELGIPVYYTVIKNTTDDLIIDLNISQKKWTIGDYIKYYALELKKESYVRLYDLIQEIPLDPTSIISMATNSLTGGSLIKRIKTGEMTMAPEEAHAARVFYSNLCVLRDVLGFPIKGKLVRAIVPLTNLRNFAWSTLFEKAKKYKVKSYYCTSIQEWQTMIVNLYNYNSKTKQIRI